MAIEKKTSRRTVLISFGRIAVVSRQSSRFSFGIPGRERVPLWLARKTPLAVFQWNAYLDRERRSPVSSNRTIGLYFAERLLIAVEIDKFRPQGQTIQCIEIIEDQPFIPCARSRRRASLWLCTC